MEHTDLFLQNKLAKEIFDSEVYIRRRIAFDSLNEQEFLCFDYYNKRFLPGSARAGKTFKGELVKEYRIMHQEGRQKYLRSFLPELDAMHLKGFRRVPFFDLFLPILKIAHLKIAENAAGPMTSQFYGRFQFVFLEALLKDIAVFSGQIFLKEFHLKRNQGNFLLGLIEHRSTYPKTEYHEFVEWYLKTGYKKIFSKYYLLLYHFETALNNWYHNLSLLLSRYAADQPLIKAFLNTSELILRTIDFGKSDYHNNGLTVCVLHFENNLAIVYKPKNVTAELKYNLFLGELNNCYHTTFATYQVLDRQTYGWTGYIDQSEKKIPNDRSLFFKNAGALLCVLYFLKATDCHFENIIQSGNDIYFIDAETIIHPEPRIFADELEELEYDNIVLQILSQSVFATGLLPNWKYNKETNVVYDVSGLGWAPDQEKPGKTINWLYVNTDGMRLMTGSSPKKRKRGISVANSSLNSSMAYQQELLSGFKAIYALIQSHLTQITAKAESCFKGVQIRFLFRSTSLYYAILRNLFSPQVASSKIRISLELERLCKALLKSSTPTNYWQIYKSEITQILSLNIPVFYTSTNSMDVFAGNLNIENVFERTSLNRITTADFSPGNLNRQLRIVEACYQSAASKIKFPKYHSVIHPAPIENKDADLVHDIAKNILGCALPDNDGLRWIGLGNLHHTDALQVQPVAHGLYQGSLGIALFLANYSSHDQSRISDTTAQQASLAFFDFFENLSPRLVDTFIAKYGIGLGGGAGAVIYGLTALGQIFTADRYQDNCSKLLKQLTRSHIDSDTNNDLLSGSAGLLLGLLKLYAVTKEAAILELAVYCGEQLLKKRVGKLWLTIDGKVPIHGFAHGSTGISYALFRLFLATGLERFKNACFETISLENKSFSAVKGNWADTRAGVHDKYKVAWCHGATGIGLQRLFLHQHYPSDQLQHDIDAAVKAIVQYPARSVDHICCGNFGRLELLYNYGLATHDMRLFKRKFGQLSDRISNEGLLLTPDYNNDFKNPVMFKGLSGIGYQLLRFSSTTTLPSILLFE